MEQAKRHGNHTMQPIVNLQYKEALGVIPYYKQITITNKKGESEIIDDPEHVKIAEPIVTEILGSNAKWDSVVNNPRQVFPSEYNEIRLTLGSKDKDYYDKEKDVPNISINTNLSPFIKNGYKLDNDNITNIPIYFIVRKPVEHPIGFSKDYKEYIRMVTETSHLSLIVFCNNVLYSIGYGSDTFDRDMPLEKHEFFRGKNDPLNYGSSKIAYEYYERFVKNQSEHGFIRQNGVVFTPDASPYEHAAKTGLLYQYEIIDIGFFTVEHSQKIINILKFQKPVMHDRKNNASIKVVEPYKIDIVFYKDRYKDYADRVYSQITFSVPNLHYKLCSILGKNKTFNCTTFIQRIIEDRIKCIGWTTSFSKPTRCYKISGDLTKNELNIIYELYRQSDGAAAGGAGGGYSEEVLNKLSKSFSTNDILPDRSTVAPHIAATPITPYPTAATIAAAKRAASIKKTMFKVPTANASRKFKPAKSSQSRKSKAATATAAAVATVAAVAAEPSARGAHSRTSRTAAVAATTTTIGRKRKLTRENTNPREQQIARTTHKKNITTAAQTLGTSSGTRRLSASKSKKNTRRSRS